MRNPYPPRVYNPSEGKQASPGVVWCQEVIYFWHQGEEPILYRVVREHLKEVRNKQYIYQGRGGIMLGSRKLMFRESLLYEIVSYFTLECIIRFFSLYFFKNWSVVNIQYYVSFRCAAQWVIYIYWYVYVSAETLWLREISFLILKVDNICGALV